MHLFKAMVLSLLLLTGCQINRDFQNQLTSDFSGTWMSESENVIYEETWIWKDKALEGVGLIYNDTDTLFVEQLQILKNLGHWHYAATISDQNDGKTVLFKLEKPYDERYVFRKKRHDFPKTIAYAFNQDSVYIEIEGEESGVFKSENLQLVRSTMRVP
jgi:hypothetical protein